MTDYKTLHSQSQLLWTKRDDWTLVGSVDSRSLYTIKRQLSHHAHPAVNWEYLPKCIADDRPIAGTYTDSKLARAACEDDLNQQPRHTVVASTKEA